MPNETLDSIMQVPLWGRAAIVLFVIWFVYMLFSRYIFMLISLVPMLFNWLWVLVYRLFNNLTHWLHKAGGKPMIGVDQAVTDFFGAIHGLFEKIKRAINNACRAKVITNGERELDENGKQLYGNTPKKPFVGAAFLITTLLVLWIAAPTWLNIEENTNFFTAAYRRYIELEGSLLEMVFVNE